MKKILLVAIIIYCGAVLKAQDKTSKQILELTQDELAKIGVIVRDNNVIYNNTMPDGSNYKISFNGNNFDFTGIMNIPKTHFDFYPYYITDVDSVSKIIQRDKHENTLKLDPLFERKMMLNHLVPVKVKSNYESKKNFNEYLLWFEPTKSFCKLIPERYKINIKYIDDTKVKSNVVIELKDEDLRKIGFVVDSEEIYLKTKYYDKGFKCTFITTWYNNKKESGTSQISGGGIDEMLKEIDEKNKDYDLGKTDYFIVRVENVGDYINYDNDYKGLIIPIYFKNKTRNFDNKNDIVIYLSLTPDLEKKLTETKWSQNGNNIKDYAIDYKTLPKK